ncbi:hypothetical protein C4568_03380 [Candidatus Parcubacteria bacterium]|nr:MAG: hypothetical protein C4568_03380 [Candidatus Parcubacteria bacterium]
MIFILPWLSIFAASLFALMLLMNLVRKNTSLVMLYLAQSLMLTLALVLLSYSTGSTGLLFAALLTLVVKVVMAPAFLLHMIRKYHGHLSAASRLNVPLSLLALAAITAFTYAYVAPALAQYGSSSASILFACIFGTLFLMTNRRGALAEIVGVLSLENAVVLLAALLGIEHSFALEFAITFDIAVWVAIAAGFLTMMYRQFGAIDAATLEMTHLTEEE